MKTQNKRAQSAVEYLMTYGWAILVIIVVGAALWKLGVFDVSKYTGSAKLAISGFTVSGSQLSAGNPGTFKAKIGAQESISGVVFNVTASGGAISSTYNDSCGISTSWSPNTEQSITCGIGANLASGTTYNVKTEITYSDTSGYSHTVSSTYNPKAE